ncbi:hypothetical protein Vretimale_17577 [Volvox reticuliferus]|uniref:Uncharacterized protein n=1 Tax=Volvox reticuliferus TaxID=1737510 RepID=A0A8J4C7V9_9CHLO|nr:hypothetical protein Vretifemale_3540 [Volvox reticuliferus]GIM14765.1 hypothetical protein Vretimale_17577 [Volvox reticuliferus]
MEQLDKEQLPQNWRAPLIKVISNHVWQVCERVDMTDPANHPNGDGSGKSPAYGAYAGPTEQLLNNAFEGALKNWEIGPFAAWIGKTKIFNDLDLQWDFAISLPNQHLTRPVGTDAAATVLRPTKRQQAGSNGDSSPFANVHGQPVTEELEEDIPVEEQWSLIVWLKPGERGTTVDMRRFTAVVDKMANPAFTKSVDGSWDIFLSHYQGNAGNTVMSLKALLESASPGLRCWLDKDEDATEAGMRRGVAGSRYYLLFLTQGVLTRPFVQLEAREALALGKPVILVHETDPRFGAAPGFNDYVSEAPPDLRQVFSLANSIPWYREEDFRAVSIKKILQAAGRTAI